MMSVHKLFASDRILNTQVHMLLEYLMDFLRFLGNQVIHEVLKFINE